MKRLFVIFLFFAFSATSFGQKYYWQSGSKEKKIKNLTVDGGAGIRMYFGDIQQDGNLFNKAKLAYGLGLRYQLHPRLGASFQFAGRGYRGYAEHGGFPDAIDEMNGQLWSGQIQFQYHWLKWEDFTIHQFTDRDPVTKTNGYLGLGIGGSLFNSSYSSRVYEQTSVIVTDTMGVTSDSSYFTPVDNSDGQGGFGMYVPVVFGLRYRFRPNWSFGAEAQYQFYINKNIDSLISNKRDRMATLIFRLGYTFGQTKKKGTFKKMGKKGWK